MTTSHTIRFTMKFVAVTGANGFVGQTLCDELLRRGFKVVALSRRTALPGPTPDLEWRHFDPNDPAPNPTAFGGCDAIVHLAGEPIAGRWTPAKWRAICDSRVAGSRRVVESIAHLVRRPSVLVSASASGYYGSRGDEVLDEASAPGNDPLARLCVDWEREALSARALGVRVTVLRTGIALGRSGALSRMLPIFRAGLGGPFGSGRQFIPWIHVDDLAAMYVWALDNPSAEGALNAVSPDYATNARFAQSLGCALRRPALLPAPAPALRLMLGKFAETLLASQLILPAGAQDAGFRWRHPTLEKALAASLPGSPTATVQTYEAEQRVPGTLQDVFAFFSNARNLEEITPPSLQFAIIDDPPEMQRGALLRYRLGLGRISLDWQTLIARWNPPHDFTDVQLHGPYALWRHEHHFAQTASGVTIHDRVDYMLPVAPFGNVLTVPVRRELERIFTYRRSAIAHEFGGGV